MSKNSYPACTYRVSAKAVIVVDGKLLLIRENGNHWDLPGGGIEHFEDIDTALKREVKEEIGLDIIDTESHSLQPWITYDYDKGWEKPILYLVYKITTSGELIPTNNTTIEFFDQSGVEKASFEKHIEKFKSLLVEAAFSVPKTR
jgi:8-oxo-dGTP pyrophosphatase MutT (NUDIX family)